MILEFHRQVTSDISRIMDYYEDVAGRLAEEFYIELRSFFQKAAESPKAYNVRERDLRRVNLERFPFHFATSRIECAHWLFATTEDDHLWVFTVVRQLVVVFLPAAVISFLSPQQSPAAV